MDLLLVYLKKVSGFILYYTLEWYKNASSFKIWLDSNEIASYIFYTYFKIVIFIHFVGVLIFLFFPEKIIRKSGRANFSDTAQSVPYEFLKITVFPMESVYLLIRNKNPLFLKITFVFFWFLLFTFFLFLDPLTLCLSYLSEKGFFDFLLDAIIKFFSGSRS